MIIVPPPHIVLNAYDVPPPDYKMWRSWRVPMEYTPEQVIRGVVTLAKDAPDGKVKTVVFNCHGSPGAFYMGTGFHKSDIPEFTALNGIVENIWIIACEVASGKKKKPSVGQQFCSDIAKTAGAGVVAAKDVQFVSAWEELMLPYGCIDDIEGPVLRWSPSGALVANYELNGRLPMNWLH